VTSSLQQAIEALYGLERRRDRLGLAGVRELLAGFGHPERTFRSVHVAGTNGKGSTCALIERALRESGYRTGLFTSPHLVDFRERIRVGGRWADESWLMQELRVIGVIPEGRDRTFFEVTTALGFHWFARRDVEWAAVEVGLGGRLDCTNVIAPDACVITALGLDHTEILGDSLEAIAREKAGIIKRDVPVIVDGDGGGAFEVIARIAAENGAPLERAGQRVTLAPAGAGRWRARTRAWGELELTFDGGGTLARNAPAALSSLDVLAERGADLPPEAIVDGFRAARWPGRFERCAAEPRLWWDGAHNPAGTETLAALWREARLAAPAAIALAVSHDKDVADMLRPLRAIAPGATLVAAQSRNPRALPAAEVAAQAAAAGWAARVVPAVPAACAAALETAGPGGIALLTGSLFAVGEAMERFGGAPGELL
jgi:dihydrofolate synthase/folylpolyglutamate synthase